MTGEVHEGLGALLRAGAPVGAALAGGLIGVLGTRPDQTAGVVVHFAAGAFAAVVFLHLLPEAIHAAGLFPAAAAAIAGWLLFALLARRTGAVCPGCAAGHTHHGLALGAPLLGVVALHSALDGFALAGTPDHAHGGDLLFAAILVHKVPEGMAIAAVCRAAGWSPGASLGLTALVEGATFAGFLGGLFLRGAPDFLVGSALGLVAGSLLYFIALALRMVREAPRPILNVGSAAAGVLIVLAVWLAGAGDH